MPLSILDDSLQYGTRSRCTCDKKHDPNKTNPNTFDKHNKKRVATRQTHNIQLANFDVASLRVIWFCSGALLGCLLWQHLMLRKHSRGAKVVSRNEWRNLWTHRLSGPKAAPPSFSHVVRHGAAGSR